MLAAKSKRSLFTHETGIVGNSKPTPGPLIVYMLLVRSYRKAITAQYNDDAPMQLYGTRGIFAANCVYGSGAAIGGRKL
jgi:hypothetical protein